ncbi:MAG: transcription antitermination factor NusB [Bryobacteraceae bacterium]
MTPRISPAREIAYDVLLAVDRGGYASDLLLARSAGLDSRDAGLAAEIVFGALRFQLQLDYLIEHYSGRAAKLDTEVRVALRMGIYQLRYLDRVPAHAAVGESVELIKLARKRSATGFANAVLRKVNRQPEVWPNRAVELSHPEWLLARWDAQFGVESTAIALANLRPPELYVRSPHGAPAGAEPTGIDGCYRMKGGEPGGYRIQDIGSQSIVPLLELGPGLTFLDLCASPGNKTAQALEYGAQAIACDMHFSRMEPLRTLGIPLVVLDGRSPLPFRRQFDRILVDAPCSGTGTLSRNPEIKWRLRPADIDDLRARQRALLEQARNALAPGGILVYSTCALEHEENEEIVGALASRTVRRTPGQDPGDGFFAAVIKQP